MTETQNTSTSRTDFVVVPGLVADFWNSPDPAHPGHSGLLAPHRGVMGPFATQAEAEECATREGFDPTQVVVPRVTRA